MEAGSFLERAIPSNLAIRAKLPMNLFSCTITVIPHRAGQYLHSYGLPIPSPDQAATPVLPRLSSSTCIIGKVQPRSVSAVHFALLLQPIQFVLFLCLHLLSALPGTWFPVGQVVATYDLLLLAILNTRSELY